MNLIETPVISQKEEEKELVDVINFKNINLSYGSFKLFDNFSLDIPDFRDEGQFISILGVSGSGKSQLLKILSGLVKPQSGEVLVYDKPRSSYTKAIPMVFQQYSAFPWMTVLENVEYPLRLQQPSVARKIYNKIRGWNRPYPSDEYIRERAANALKTVGLEGQENKWAQYPTLSGGQLQRVSLARNLVSEAQIILLDEATSALDIFAKRDMQDALLNVYYSSKFDPTIINVTHDISEAVYLSNRIYILQANPCRVYKVIDVKFPGIERRTSEIKKTPEFTEYVRLVEQTMNEISL